MGYPVEIFETLYGFHEFLRDTRNIKPARQASADELAGKVQRHRRCPLPHHPSSTHLPSLSRMN
ncbi:hypothetical protein [Thermomonas sp.]|uniref:hypothetical protein n=1 Tax=Thermomonas sp. TaxID=1971895 RepID=UPI00260A82F1|nr:hypothetical protein [Thermomonas sp.]MCO5055458.1 hypothetical protein [Thermomonas sp.]